MRKLLGSWAGVILVSGGLAGALSPGTVSAQSREPASEEAASGSTLYFPDYVDGGGWSVQLALSNVARRAPAAVAVTAYDQDGQPVELFDEDVRFELPPLGSRVLTSAGTGAVRRGWIEVRSDPPSVGGLLTYSHSGTGAEVGVAPVSLGDQFALFVEESDTAGSGLAIFKPDVESRIELRLRDEEGNDPLDGVYLPWKDFHQRARTLPEWFDSEGVDAGFLGNFRGLLFLRTPDKSGFTPLGLRFGKGTNALSAVPAVRITDGVRIGDGAEIDGGVGIDGGGQAPPPVTVAVSERAALVALYEATDGPNWVNNENWLTDAPLEEWSGPSHTRNNGTGSTSREQVYAFTSAPADRATPRQLLAYNRGHWSAEVNHHLRDTLFAEDTCLARTHFAPTEIPDRTGPIPSSGSRIFLTTHNDAPLSVSSTAATHSHTVRQSSRLRLLRRPLGESYGH